MHLQMRLPEQPEHLIEQTIEGRLVGCGQRQGFVLAAQSIPVQAAQGLVEVLVAHSGPGAGENRLSELIARRARVPGLGA